MSITAHFKGIFKIFQHWSITRALCGHFQCTPDIFLSLLKEMSVCSVSMNVEDINNIIPVQADGAHFLCVVKLHQSNSTIPPSAKWRGLLGPVTVLLFNYPQPGLNCYIQTFNDQDNISITAVTSSCFLTVALNYLHPQQWCVRRGLLICFTSLVAMRSTVNSENS